MCMDAYLHAHMFTPCTPGPCRSQKRAWDPLELELQMVMNHHVVLGL